MVLVQASLSCVTEHNYTDAGTQVELFSYGVYD